MNQLEEKIKAKEQELATAKDQLKAHYQAAMHYKGSVAVLEGVLGTLKSMREPDEDSQHSVPDEGNS